MNTLLHRLILPLLVALILAAPVRADVVEYFFEPGRMSHSFFIEEIPASDFMTGHEVFGYVNDGSSDGARGLVRLVDPESGHAFRLWDLTTGDSLDLPWPGAGRDLRGIIPWTFASTPRKYFLIGGFQESCWRSQHVFALVQPDGSYYPATASFPSGAWGTDTFGEVSATYDPAQSFQLLDLTAWDIAGVNQTFVSEADWQPYSAPSALVAVSIHVNATEEGHLFTVHRRVPGCAVMTESVTATTYPWATEPVLKASVGVGMEFWVTRDADNYSTLSYTGTPWIAEAGNAWIDGDGSWGWWAGGLFPDPPQRTTEPRTFRVHAQRWGHTLTVRQSDGYAFRFIDYGNASGAIGGYTAETIMDWNDQGLYNPVEMIVFSASIDPTRAWWLCDETMGETFPVAQTDFFDGWVPRHTAPPEFTTISIRLPSSRFLSPFRLSCPMGEEIWSDFNTRMSPGPEAETIAGLDGMAEYQLLSFQITLPNPTPYISEGFLLQDMADGASPTPHPIHAGENDLRRWYAPTQSLYLTISSSRWDHELLIRHPDGTAYPVVKHQTQGNVSFDAQQNAWQSSYYWFDATAACRPELPWYLEDASTGERIGPNPGNDTLINWFALPAPAGLTGTVNASTGEITLQWPLGSAASEGGFEVERLLSGETHWQTIGTKPASTADAGNLLHFSDPNPVAGRVHYYRVRYTYGAGPAFRHSAPSNLVALSEWQDDDGDGMPDWWEDKHGLARGSGGDAASDADGDGVSNLDEYLAGSDPTDPLSCPYKVTSFTPDDEQHGHDTNGVILLYLNKPLPTATTTLPGGIVTHTADGGATWQAVAGTAMVLPGGKGVAFVPTADFIPHAAGVSQSTYRIDFTAATTGLAPVVPFHSRFSVEDPDPVGPWVKQTWPGDDHTEVAVDFAPIVQWSEPLRADTVIDPANVSLRPEGGTVDLPVTVTFDYATNRLTIAPAAFLQPDTVYHAALSTGFKNLMGLPLLDVYRWSFQTRPIPPPPPPGTPHVTMSDPQAYATGLPVDTAFTFTFSEDMDSATLTDQTILLRAIGSPDDVPVQIDYPAPGVLTVTPTAALSPGTRYVLALDENVIQSAATPPTLLGGQTRLPFATASSGGRGPGGGPGGPGGSPEPGKPKPVRITASYGSSGSTDQQGGYAMAEITKPDGSKTTQKGDKLNAPNKASATFTVEAEDGSTIKITPKKVIASAALAPASGTPAGGAAAAPETGLGGENYVIFKQTGPSADWVYVGKASNGGTFDSAALEVGHFFAPIFESKDYSRGFDPPLKDSSITNPAPFHEDYRTSVCRTTAINPNLLPGPIGQQDLHINDHILVVFPNPQVAQNCDVVIKENDEIKIDFAPPAVLAKENSLTIKGKVTGTAAIYIYAKRQQDGAIGNARTTLATLTVDVLPPVTLKLGIWFVWDSRNGDTEIPANVLPITGDILKRVNAAFRSACIIFEPVNGTQGPLLNAPYDQVFTSSLPLRGSVPVNGILDLDLGPANAKNPELTSVDTRVGTAVSGATVHSKVVLVNAVYDPIYTSRIAVTEFGSNQSLISLWTPPGDDPFAKLELNCAHKVGHQLSLYSLSPPQGDGHDPGPFPTDSQKKIWYGLMKNGGGFEWLRHQDWNAANTNAQSK